ncbi:Nuclear pore complex protein [Actinidia chinensis var. chinensis]|uniref:Nuclear pore complex protein n=1 Tax=Actinidia chinensis var. chinensis TaxID=1590841 RepID=A0A2R6QAS1_ACTCC|nr:Nuclear pore complex protein [Actinidia chinensis var. chinensis]
MGTTEAGEGTSYEGGVGAGGKFRKRPFRKPQATPYDRPPTALRNRRTDGWLSKIVDPASKLISATAHLFFSSLSRKRLPPAPPRPPPEANQESRERFHEAVPDHPPEVQGPAINDGGKVTNSSSSSGLSELEQILKQKTFTRAEIDRLTELLQSRSDDLPNGVEGNRTKSNLRQPVSAIDFLELDEEIHSNKAASTLLAERKEKLEVSVVEDRVVSSEAVTVDKTPSVSDVRTLAGPVFEKSTDFGTSDGTVGEKKMGFNLPTAPASSISFQLVMASPQSTSAFDKTVALKEPNAPPLFSFSSKNVDEIPPLKFSSSSSVSEVLKSSAPLEPKPQSPNSLVNVASGGTDVLPKIPESDKGDMKDMQKYGDTVGRSEISISSAIATSTSTSKIFSFGAPASSSNLSNGSLDSSPSIFSSPSPVLASINFTNQTFTNSFTNVAPSTTATITTDGGTAIVHTSSSSLSTSATAPSFPAASIFKFGSTSVAPTNSVSTVSTTSNAETTDLKAKIVKDITFGNLTSSPYGGASFAMASTGSNMFGFSASAASSSANNFSQGSIFGSSSESLVSKQASSAGTGVAAVMQSMPIQFGSSAPSPTFGTSETTSFTSSPSIFGSSTSRSSLFGASTPTVTGPSTGFGQSTSASLSETNSISSGGVTWQAPKPSIFGSNTASPSTMFPFGASAITAAATNSAPMVFGSSTGASSGLVFSFTSASATASSSQTQPVFGSSVPVFTAASGNGDQMNMEDNMSEDPVQASTPTFPVFGQTAISVASSTPTVPVFGQPPNPISNPSSGSVFAPSAGQPFQFGGQQNQSTPQNPPAFQASNSLGFSAGGSFSLGSAGNDKGNRRIVRVKHKSRRN